MAILLEVFDPAMCCSTGVCGPEVDPKLVHFAADLDWLKSKGVEVRRHNLAHEPAEFIRHPQIKDLLQTKGTAALPAILIDGRLCSAGQYPSRPELAAAVGVTVESGGAVGPVHGSELAASQPVTGCGCGSTSAPVSIGVPVHKNTKCCGS